MRDRSRLALANPGGAGADRARGGVPLLPALPPRVASSECPRSRGAKAAWAAEPALGGGPAHSALLPRSARRRDSRRAGPRSATRLRRARGGPPPPPPPRTRACVWITGFVPQTRDLGQPGEPGPPPERGAGGEERAGVQRVSRPEAVMAAHKGSSDTVCIWGSGSPACWRVLMAMEEKGITYESKLITFSRSVWRHARAWAPGRLRVRIQGSHVPRSAQWGAEEARDAEAEPAWLGAHHHRQVRAPPRARAAAVPRLTLALPVHAGGPSCLRAWRSWTTSSGSTRMCVLRVRARPPPRCSPPPSGPSCAAQADAGRPRAVRRRHRARARGEQRQPGGRRGVSCAGASARGWRAHPRRPCRRSSSTTSAAPRRSPCATST